MPCQVPNRITSYNVCYTKLLRGVEQRLPTHQPVKIAAVAIGPIQHGRDAEAAGGISRRASMGGDGSEVVFGSHGVLSIWSQCGLSGSYNFV